MVRPTCCPAAALAQWLSESRIEEGKTEGSARVVLDPKRQLHLRFSRRFFLLSPRRRGIRVDELSKESTDKEELFADVV